MKRLIKFAAEVQSFCEARGWKFCFIGGLAVQVWSEPRLTRDADLALLTGFSKEEPFVDDFLGWLQPRRAGAREHALKHRILLLQSDKNIELDVSLGALPYEELLVARSVVEELLPGVSLRICTAEDLIILKVFAARSKDWLDIEGVILRQGDDKLDWHYIHEQLPPLLELKEQPELMNELGALRKRLRRGG